MSARKVAADAFGINLVMLGSEAPVDDIPREIAILNQIVNDPTIDGVIMTTPQSGAYDDIVKKLEEHGVPVATTNSFDPNIYDRSKHQPHRPGRLGGRRSAARRWPNACSTKGVKGGSIIFPNTDHARQRSRSTGASPRASRPP